MAIIGADAVRAAAESGRLRLAPGDRLTPLAKETARDLGILVEDGTATSAPAPGRAVGTRPGKGPRSLLDDPPAYPDPPSNALLRRGAPIPPRLRPVAPGSSGRAMVVGAGHVGQITALRLVEADCFEEVVLVDVADGLAAGIALDLTHSAALGHFATAVRGETSVAAAGACDYVVITAGKPRQPGMSRSDLISANAAIVGAVAKDVARTSPESVIVVVTNPLDEMTQHAWQVSGFAPERVVGMAGVLDTARFQALASLGGDFRADRVHAFALGSHGEEMVVPLSQATAGNLPIDRQLTAEATAAVVDRTRNSGAEVVGLLKTGSAFMAPGTSAAHMVLAMKRRTGEVLPAAVYARGEYGIEDVYVGLPVRLGEHGVERIVELDLTEEELAGLRHAADRIRTRLAGLDDVTRPSASR